MKEYMNCSGMDRIERNRNGYLLFILLGLFLLFVYIIAHIDKWVLYQKLNKDNAPKNQINLNEVSLRGLKWANL